MNVLQPKKSYKLNYIALIPPTMAILSEVGVWMPILNVFSIFLGVMGIICGACYMIKVKRCTKKKISEFGLIALGNMIWIIAMITCAIMKFTSVSYADNMNKDFMSQLMGFGCHSDKNNQSEAQNKSRAYKAHDTADLDGVKITLTDVRKNFKTEDEKFTPRHGSQFVMVNVRIENDSNSELGVSENDIKIQDSQGAIEPPISATYNLDEPFEGAILLPGGTRQGAVIFEVPEDDDSLKIIYTSPLSDGQKAEFEL